MEGLLLDVPGSHLTYGMGVVKRAWVSPTAWRTIAYAVCSGAEIGNRPFRKFTFPMAREGG